MGKAHLNQVIASHFVEIKANETPGKPIFIFEKGNFGEDVVTYQELHEKSNKIARWFVEQGIGKGDHFAIYMRNHPEFIYALLGGIVVGAIAVPVDPRYKGDRLKFIINHSTAKAVLCSGECLADLEEIANELPQVKTVIVSYYPEQEISPSPKYETLNEILEQDTWETVDQQIMDVRHPMQIIYTSGTTGDPKGVLIRNNRTGLYSILTQIVWQYKPHDILYSGLSFSHGNAQAVTLFPALYSGTKAVFSQRFTKSRIWDICRKYGCTSFSLLGGMMAAIYNEPPRPDDGDNPVKTVISAGTPKAIWESFEERFNVQILEWYGSVEGGFAYKPPGKGPIGSFGKGIPGVMELKVVDENDNEVKAGVTGELIFRMLRGETKVDYLGLPEESKKKTAGGWLRSGDMVHRDEKGWFYFDYRKGTELRRAGDFIQPDHIEKIIGEHPAVSEVCVFGIPAASGAPGESDLVAAISPFEGKTIEPAAIYEKCKKELSANFIPSYLHILDDLPKTISEKPLERVLREMFNKGQGTIYAAEDYI
ncbi:MAG: AMP-binding protein [Dethiobacteria bacterium]|jgi:acyl-CoA synthetase (AMP-forming)/AMP-acid ligase II|nr:AMP-binding protein [Bacillota bacterium]NMD32773.1 AMP-binding protein [Bacillota bacterium]HOB28831.1 AMP-binding protein [Bacillota bacterium]HPZ41585.1 AMP-binding protein [Bacillota bacterium]HQD51570.1 AMP-binding protein [Bacillota bacterium]